MAIKISPNYTSEYLEGDLIERKIDVINDRVMGWFINWADYLNKEEHAGFAVLHLIFSYFEFISIFEKGEDSNRKSRSFFKDGLKSVFPSLNAIDENILKNFSNIMYESGRCGFFHSGMAKKGIVLFDHDHAITFQGENIFIDRYRIF